MEALGNIENGTRRQLRWVTLIVLTALLVSEPFARASDDMVRDEFDSLVAQWWEFELQENPLQATRVGDHRFNDRLPSMSLADARRRHEERRELKRRLDQLDTSKLDPLGQVNYTIFGRQLDAALAEFEFKTYLTPITNREGFHIGFPDLRKTSPLNSADDYRDFIARIKSFKSYAEQHIQLMRAGVEAGYTLPSVVLEGYQEPIVAHIVDDPEKSLLFEPFTDFPSSFTPTEQRELAERARQAIRDSVVPGYQAFLDFMHQEYVPQARGSIGASALPAGRDYYRFCVRKFTTLPLTPEEVHQTGMSEVQRIRGEMQVVIRRTDFEGEFAEFLEFLRTDERFYANTPEQLLKETALVLKRMDGQLPRLFNKLPRTPYGIREIPAYIAPQTTSAYYMQPAGDGSQAGFYYVNTFRLRSRPLYGVEALSLHEAVPGHHLQLALQQEMDLPAFRRFADFTAFIEGWALYAERLGLEVGFYQDPYSDFGRLTYEMWRACRLVVDTGIHYLGWSRQQAIEFMQENSGLSKHNIRAEVDRYISWPGQALAYKIGELKIRQLRQKAEAQLGTRFDIRDFHGAVLNGGAIPLDVLEQQVNRYIADAIH